MPEIGHVGVKATDDFHQMDEKTKNCQNVEAFEDCTTRKYLEKLDHECSCVPYKLRNFSEINQVGKRSANNLNNSYSLDNL